MVHLKGGSPGGATAARDRDAAAGHASLSRAHTPRPAFADPDREAALRRAARRDLGAAGRRRLGPRPQLERALLARVESRGPAGDILALDRAARIGRRGSPSVSIHDIVYELLLLAAIEPPTASLTFGHDGTASTHDSIEFAASEITLRAHPEPRTERRPDAAAGKIWHPASTTTATARPNIA